MDLERIYNKLDSMDIKLDGHLERIAKLEIQQEEMAGKIKIAFSLIVAGISASVTAALNWILGLFPSN